MFATSLQGNEKQLNDMNKPDAFCISDDCEQMVLSREWRRHRVLRVKWPPRPMGVCMKFVGCKLLQASLILAVLHSETVNNSS